MPAQRATTAAEDSAVRGEIRGLTGLRIVAAIWVVGFHFHFTALPGVAEVVDLLGPLVRQGALGVDLFFVLSGFVIAHTYLGTMGPAWRTGQTLRFVWARVCRMWPVYVLVLHLFGAWMLLRATVGDDGQVAFQAVQPGLNLGQYVQQLFMVQLWDDPYFDGASWIGATWSISAEWLAYLLFPLAALGFHRLRRLPIAVLTVAATALMAPIAVSYLAIGNPYFPWSWLVRILCGFSAGVLALLVVRRLGGTDGGAGERVRRGASVLAVVVPLLIAAGLLAGELAGPGRGGAVIVLFPVLVAAIALADRGPATVLATRPAGYGGRISYALYVVHIPIFEVYWLGLALRPDLAGPTATAHLLGLGVIASSFLAAALAHRWVEEPARRQMRGWLPRRPAHRLVRGARTATVAAGWAPTPRRAADPARQPAAARG